MISRNLLILISGYTISWCIMALAFSATASVGYDMTLGKSIALFPLIMQVFGACIITMPAVKIMALYGRRTGFMVGSVIGIFGGLMCAYSVYHQNFWLLVCSTPFLGMFTGFGEFARYAAADTCDHKQQKSRAISIVISGGILAAFAGPSIASYSNQ
jgi:MFS family permease